MPLSAVRQNDFRNREAEMERLLRLAADPDAAAARSVLLLGPRGIGKSELLRQLHHRLFWAEGSVVPFYYRFRRATLKAGHFSRDYFSRFIRQFVSCLARDPSLAGNMSVPLYRLLSSAPDDSHEPLSELIDDFHEQTGNGDLPGRLYAAISAPRVLAARTGRRVVVLLDDFQLAEDVYEKEPGDTPGVVSIFEDSINSQCCPHVITGSPETALESIFADDSLRGITERLMVGPLPAAAAYGLFEETCLKSGSESVSTDCEQLVRHLGGNPLYIMNLARALGRSGAKEVDAEAFMEHYSREVTEGETAAYWSSVMGRDITEPGLRPLAARLLARLAGSSRPAPEPARIAREFGMSEKAAGLLVGALNRSGMLPSAGASGTDTVLQDFIAGAQMLAGGADGPQSVREAVRRRRFGREAAPPLSFEMVIPRASEAELVAAKAVEQICAGVELDNEEVQRLVLALIEACINAMEHAGGRDDRVFLKCEVYPERLELSVESEGSVDPDALLRGSQTMPGIDSRRGRGLSMIGRLVDDIKVQTTGGRTRVVLVKGLRGVQKADEELHS